MKEKPEFAGWVKEGEDTAKLYWPEKKLRVPDA